MFMYCQYTKHFIADVCR